GLSRPWTRSTPMAPTSRTSRRTRRTTATAVALLVFALVAAACGTRVTDSQVAAGGAGSGVRAGSGSSGSASGDGFAVDGSDASLDPAAGGDLSTAGDAGRSEERRVGKGRRSRRAPEAHEKKTDDSE